MSHKTVYQTDTNGVYLGEVQADSCPIEEGTWLIPAGCVETPPPFIPAGKKAVWGAGGWRLVAELKGLTAYSTTTLEPLPLDDHVELPRGFTLQTPGPFQIWQNDRWVDDITALHRAQASRVNAACEATITAGFLSSALGTPHRYSSQLDDQLNLTGAILRGLEMPYACRDEQGVRAFRLHTAEQLRQVGDDFTLHKLQLLQHANELKQQLDLALAADDLEAMQAITWEAAAS